MSLKLYYFLIGCCPELIYLVLLSLFHVIYKNNCMNKQKIAWILHEVFTNPANHGPRGLPERHCNIIIYSVLSFFLIFIAINHCIQILYVLYFTINANLIIIKLKDRIQAFHVEVIGSAKEKVRTYLKFFSIV